jgi:copper(I)-binding protein
MKHLVWLILGCSLAGTANAASFKITDAWAQPSVSAEMGAAYVTLQSDAPCTVIAADASDVTKVTELHSHTMENGVMQMRKIDALKLSANTPEIFAPGGNHVMLIGLKKPLRDGDSFKLTLTSRECGTASTSVSVSKARLQEALK